MRITPKSNGGSPNVMINKKQNMEEEVNRIIKVVCDYFGFTPNQILIKTNKRDKTRVRHFIRYFLKQKTRLSLKQIGAYTNRCDHATTINSVRLISDLIEIDKEYKKYHADLTKLLGNEQRKEFSREEIIKAFEIGRIEDFEALNNLLNATHEKEKENNCIGNDSGHSFARISGEAIPVTIQGI